jgi:hypothetical protein
MYAHYFVLILSSSPELKAQVSFSDRLQSVIHLPICLLDFFSRTTWPILTRLGTNITIGGHMQELSHFGSGTAHTIINERDRIQT